MELMDIGPLDYSCLNFPQCFKTLVKQSRYLHFRDSMGFDFIALGFFYVSAQGERVSLFFNFLQNQKPVLVLAD